jgi:hypothetical protein
VIHVRSQIRQAVQAALGAVPGVAGVYAGHVYPLDVFPSLVVTTAEEVVEEDSRVMGAHDLQFRALEVEVQIRAAAVADLDTALDSIAADVEVALAGDESLGGLCRTILYAGASVELSDEVEPPVGLCRLAYQVQYRLRASAPDTPA